VAQARLSVRKIREVLRLRAEGYSEREIARSVGAARSSIQICLWRAERAGVGFPRSRTAFRLKRPKSSGIGPEHRPPSHRNTVRHQSGTSVRHGPDYAPGSRSAPFPNRRARAGEWRGGGLSFANNPTWHALLGNILSTTFQVDWSYSIDCCERSAQPRSHRAMDLP
jgi:hypothetical protein